jgi:hypothetical protein
MAGDSRRIIGAANPFALAELRAGRRIDWQGEGVDKMLAQLLDLPTERLMDPKFGSPIYAGVPLDFSRSRCPAAPDPATLLPALFAETPRAAELVDLRLVSDSILHAPPTNVRRLAADTAEQLATDLKGIAAPCQRQANREHLHRSSELQVASRLIQLSGATLVKPGTTLERLDRDFVIINPDWFRHVLSDLNFGLPGEYFVDAPTATSPVQGALADCWLIAAMASVAWTRPELVSERVRRTNPTGDVDAGSADFRFDFTDVLTISLGFITIQVPYVFPVWVGEQVPQAAWGGYLYARSSVAGETWPADLEKSVAVWRSGGNPDFPNSADYGHLNGGDPAWAVHILIGGAPWYHWADADDTWSIIQSNSSAGRTTTPLVAWTWGSSDDSPKKEDYGGAHLVANHAYSILGTWETNRRQYVVLRNPWGTYEGTLNTFAGGWSTQESWGTATLTLPGSGVFALEIHTFRDYFMGFGGSA